MGSRTIDAPAPPAARDRPPAPQLSARKQVAFALVALLLVLGLVEGSVRLYHFVRNLGHPTDPRGYIVDDPDEGYTLKPGFDEGGIRVDSLGFRGPEVSLQKAPGTYRIVAIGDSATFGPHESECAYPYQLPALLAPRQVESIDAAIEGYRSDRALARLKKQVMPLHPDLVTVFIGWNDLYQTDPRNEADQLSIQGNPLAEALMWSDAAQTFRRLYFLRFNPQRLSTSAIGDEHLLATYHPVGYGERLREIFRTARAGGADVLAITWPTILSDHMSPQAIAKAHYPWYTTQLSDLKALYARYQETLRQVASEENVPVVDAAAAFDSQVPDKATIFQDSAHLSCDGQTIVANQIAQAIRSGAVPSFTRQ